mgnify:CR=1 FL=1
MSFSFCRKKMGKNQTKPIRIKGIIEGAATISDCKTRLANGRLVNGSNISKVNQMALRKDLWFIFRFNEYEKSYYET